MSRKIFRKLNKLDDYWSCHYDPSFVALLICFSVMGVFMIFMNVKWANKVIELKKEISILQTTHIHTWIMDESCSDQLMNSKDGTLRIKIK